MDEMDAVTKSPLLDPVVVIGGMRLTLKWTFIAELEADKLGLDVPALIRTLKAANVGRVSSIMKLFVAMTAHNFLAVGQPVPSVDYWAVQIDTSPELFKAICDAVVKVLNAKMTAPAQTKLREPASNQEPEYKPN